MRPLPAELKKSLEAALVAYEQNLDRAGPYLQGRGIDRASSARMRLGVALVPHTAEHERMVGRLVIPSLGKDSAPYALKFRCIEDHDCKEHDHPKYLNLGQGTRLYNIRAIHQAGRYICLTEGEFDALTLEHLGYAAVGVPGVNGWKRHHPRMLAGFERVYVFGDGDNAGREFVKRVVEDLPGGVGVTMGEGEDVSSLYVREGREPIDRILRGEA